jgi:ribonuclease HII
VKYQQILIAGVDEAGCGPLAGPVTAASVVLPPGYVNAKIADSKSLSARQREILYGEIVEVALAYSIVSVGSRRIDRINIRESTRLAHRFAINRLLLALQRTGSFTRTPVAVHFLIDGHLPLETTASYETIIKGDSKLLVIGAASILAKVTRDRLMTVLDQRYPGYGFTKHKGYGTRLHLESIAACGPSPVHRRTFAGVKEFVGKPHSHFQELPADARQKS